MNKIPYYISIKLIEFRKHINKANVVQELR